MNIVSVCVPWVFFRCGVYHADSIQPGAVKSLHWCYWVHLSYMHPVTSENQFHDTRLYAVRMVHTCTTFRTLLYVRTHIHTQTHRHTDTQTQTLISKPWHSFRSLCADLQLNLWRECPHDNCVRIFYNPNDLRTHLNESHQSNRKSCVCQFCLSIPRGAKPRGKAPLAQEVPLCSISYSLLKPNASGEVRACNVFFCATHNLGGLAILRHPLTADCLTVCPGPHHRNALYKNSNWKNEAARQEHRSWTRAYKQITVEWDH